MKKKAVYIILLVIAVGFAGYKYMYKSHRDVQTEKAAYEVTALKLVEEFGMNAEAATTKYINKVVLVSGTVTNQEKNNITVDNSVFAQFSDQSIEVSGKINFKGRCLGYDELLEEIKFDQCTIIE